MNKQRAKKGPSWEGNVQVIQTSDFKQQRQRAKESFGMLGMGALMTNIIGGLGATPQSHNRIGELNCMSPAIARIR